MPIYEYKCDSCGDIVEVMQKVMDLPLDTCSKCSGSMRKVISPAGLIFKGSGWYITDYSSKGKKPEGGEEKKKGEKEKVRRIKKKKSGHN